MKDQYFDWSGTVWFGTLENGVQILFGLCNPFAASVLRQVNRRFDSSPANFQKCLVVSADENSILTIHDFNMSFNRVGIAPRNTDNATGWHKAQRGPVGTRLNENAARWARS